MTHRCNFSRFIWLINWTLTSIWPIDGTLTDLIEHEQIYLTYRLNPNIYLTHRWSPNRSIWPIDRILIGSTTQCQNGLEIKGKDRCPLHSLDFQTWSLTIRYILLSYSRHLFFFTVGESYCSAGDTIYIVSPTYRPW